MNMHVHENAPEYLFEDPAHDPLKKIHPPTFLVVTPVVMLYGNKVLCHILDGLFGERRKNPLNQSRSTSAK
jgi:hypothetical protein